MSKEIEQLRRDLESDGWMFGSPMKNTGVSWYAYKRLIGGVNCLCNDKPPSLIIQPHEIHIPGQGIVHQSATFEIVGQLENTEWVNFDVYGVKIEDVMKSILECTNILLTAWNSVAKDSIKVDNPFAPVNLRMVTDPYYHLRDDEGCILSRDYWNAGKMAYIIESCNKRGNYENSLKKIIELCKDGDLSQIEKSAKILELATQGLK